MEDGRMGGRSPEGGRESRPGRRAAFGLTGLVAVWGLAAVPVAGQAPLRWRFEPGDTLRYRVVTSASSRSEGLGDAIEVATEQAVTTTGVVRSVAANGDATVDWTYTRVEVASSGPPEGTLRWDSATDPFLVSVPTALRPQIELLSGRIGRTVTSVATERGEVRDLAGVQAITDALLASVTDPVLVQRLRGGTPLITSESIRQTFGGAAAFLPDGPVAVGSVWTTPRGEPGTSPRPRPTIELRNRVESVEVRGGERVAAILHEGVVPVESGGVPGEVRLTGSTLFSLDRGRVLSSTLTTESIRETPVPILDGSGPVDMVRTMRSVSIATMETELLP